MAIAVDVPVVADVETMSIEAAEVDARATGVQVGTTHVEVREEPFASGEEVADSRIDHYVGLRGLLILGEKRLLLIPCLAGGVGDWRLADEVPGDQTAQLGEGLAVVVPGVLVAAEQAAIDLSPDLEDREREGPHEKVCVLALAQDRLTEADLAECRELGLLGLEAEVPDCLLDAEEA